MDVLFRIPSRVWEEHLKSLQKANEGLEVVRMSLANEVQPEFVIVGRPGYIRIRVHRQKAREVGLMFPTKTDSLKSIIENSKLQPPEVEEIEISESGGKNGKIDGRFDLLHPVAIKRLAAVLGYGEKKYGPTNWMLDEPELHLSHCINHLLEWQRRRWLRRVNGLYDTRVPYTSDGKDDELGHAITRLMFAIVCEQLTDEELEYVRQCEGVE